MNLMGGENSMIRPLAEIEKEAILDAMRETKDAIKAADQLQIGHTTIYRKLKDYGVRPDSFKNQHTET